MESVEVVFFFNDTATTEIYTLSLHDALPICPHARRQAPAGELPWRSSLRRSTRWPPGATSPPSRPRPCWRRSRSEEHTSELQSRQYLVCRLLLEKKKKHKHPHILYQDKRCHY